MRKVEIFTKVFLVIVGLAFLNVAVQAIANPQTVMDFVGIHLDNLSARSSTRAYYGGVNLTFGLFLIVGAFKMQKEALMLAGLYGAGFVSGRLYGIITEGLPNSFVMTWLAIEAVLTLITLLLLQSRRKAIHF
jgi:hypothetical protein